MARQGYKIFDADTHLYEPVEQIEAYLSAPTGPDWMPSPRWSNAPRSKPACRAIALVSARPTTAAWGLTNGWRLPP